LQWQRLKPWNTFERTGEAAVVKNQARDGRGGVWFASIEKLAKTSNEAAIRDDRKN
jgi:hypothetical protein